MHPHDGWLNGSAIYFASEPREHPNPAVFGTNRNSPSSLQLMNGKGGGASGLSIDDTISLQSLGVSRKNYVPDHRTWGSQRSVSFHLHVDSPRAQPIARDILLGADIRRLMEQNTSYFTILQVRLRILRTVIARYRKVYTLGGWL